MIMYRSLALRRFRAIESLEVRDLRRINLIVGRNNSGKTSLLEAVFLLCGATNPVFPMTIAQMRGQRLGGSLPDPIWRPLFYRLDPRQSIEVEGQWNDDAAARSLLIEALQVRSYTDYMDRSSSGAGVAHANQDFAIGGVQLTYRSATVRNPIVTTAVFDPKTGNVDAPSKDRGDFVRSTYLSARAYASMSGIAERFSHLVRNKDESEVVQALKLIEPAVERLEVVSEAGVPTVYADIGLPALVPLAVCGEGLVRLFSIAVELTASRQGVLLIDELDNGLHHSVMEPMWRLLGEMAERHDVQIFATTHNDELIRQALKAFPADRSQLGLFRIDRRAGRHSATGYDESTFQIVMEEGFEVRG
jgi:hypothetical protein